MMVAMAAIAIWLYLLCGRGGFWRMRRPAPEGTLPEPAPRVAAGVPACNEAPLVARAIRSLAAQQYPGEFRIVLVDDNSTDGTAGAARRAAPEGVLTVAGAAPLPPGWTGKLWAVSEGIRRATAFDPEYFLLTDADIVHPPGSLRLLTARARAGDYDLVSYMATLNCRSLAERALVPAFVFFFLCCIRRRGSATRAAPLPVRPEAACSCGGPRWSVWAAWRPSPGS